MCIFGKKQSPTPQSTAPAAEAAQQTDVGSKRSQENIDLFGGVPDLKVDRSATEGGLAADGSGLRML